MKQAIADAQNSSFNRADPRVHTRLEVPVGQFPSTRAGFDDAAGLEKLVISTAMDPVIREQYRQLAATLHRAQAERAYKVMMFTSALAGEGKTLTATNLALTFSESYGRHVLLIDADLRNPMIHTILNISQEEPLPSDADAVFPVRQIRPRLSVMFVRSRRSDPFRTLTSSRMRQVIEEAREAYQWVLIDTPPVGLLPDANLLATMVDGVVLVVAAGRTKYAAAQRAADAIGRQRLLGVVLNRADPRQLVSIDHYAHYFANAGV